MSAHRHAWNTHTAVLGILGAASLVRSSGCIDEEGKGTLKGTLGIGIMDSESTIACSVCSSVKWGTWDVLNYYNSQPLGYRGYKFEFDTTLDHQYSSAAKGGIAPDIYALQKAKPNWDRVIAFFGLSTAAVSDVIGNFDVDQKPAILATYATHLSSPVAVTTDLAIQASSGVGTEAVHIVTDAHPYAFIAGMDYSSSIRAAITYMRTQQPAKIAFAYAGNTAARNWQSYFEQPIPAGKAFAASLNQPVGPDLLIPLPADSQDYTTTKAAVEAYFANGANNDVEWFWCGNMTRSCGHFARALAEVRGGATKVVAAVFGFDETVGGYGSEAFAGNNPTADLLHGVMVSAAYGDMRAEGMAHLLEVHDFARIARGEPTTLYRDASYVKGHLRAMILLRGLDKLIDDGQEMTGPNLKAALESFDNLSTAGLSAPVTYSSSDHRPNTAADIYTVDERGLLNFVAQSQIERKPEWLGW